MGIMMRHVPPRGNGGAGAEVPRNYRRGRMLIGRPASSGRERFRCSSWRLAKASTTTRGIGAERRTRMSTNTGELAGMAGTTSAATAGVLAVAVAGADLSAVSFGYNQPGVGGELIWSDSDGDAVLPSTVAPKSSISIR